MAIIPTLDLRHGVPLRFFREVTIDFSSCAANDTTEDTLAVTGALKDMLFLVPQVNLEDGLVWAEPPRVETDGTVTFKLGNLTGSPIDPASMTFVLAAI